MQRYARLAFSASLLVACAGTSGPFYEFRPTDEPLRYEISDQGALTIDTPVGAQRSVDSTRAMIALEVRGRTAEGRQTYVTFEALDVWAGGDFNSTHIEGAELIGQRYTGTLSENGVITVSDAPEIPSGLAETADPAEIFVDLLLPLPPGGVDAVESWPHRRTTRSDAGMEIDASYDGTAFFAGDTTWNGVSARIVVSEGLSTVSGRGMPAGAPGEVEFTFSGRSVTRYVWDPQRGVMLAASSRTDAEGDLEVIDMQMTMPITYEGVRTVWLR
jgi:hypothetical protein